MPLKVRMDEIEVVSVSGSLFSNENNLTFTKQILMSSLASSACIKFEACDKVVQCLKNKFSAGNRDSSADGAPGDT